MQQSFESSEHRLSQISVDLLNAMAEIQRLRRLVEAAEASRLNRQSKKDRTVIAPPADSELRV
jgi:hypothetical protein